MLPSCLVEIEVYKMILPNSGLTFLGTVFAVIKIINVRKFITPSIVGFFNFSVLDTADILKISMLQYLDSTLYIWALIFVVILGVSAVPIKSAIYNTIAS